MRIPAELLRRCWFLAGPTASGKSAVGLELAERLRGEILSLDSMAVFTGMDIGTAKPDAADRARVPHHLLDLVHPADEFSSAQYLRAAEAAIQDVLSRNRVPIFVGGTGLYLRSLLRGVFEGPAADWDFRRELETRAATLPADWLWRQLQSVDAVSAARLHPNDARRLVRALEIQHLTGRPASQQQQELPLPEDERPRNVWWLSPPRAWLGARIDQRVRDMFARGLVEETRQLLSDPHPPGRTARQALGYREVIDLLEGRLESMEATISLIQTRTRQFAKRQHTWFRNLEECREWPITGDESATVIAKLMTSRR